MFSDCCRIRWLSAQPCMGSPASVRRISRSRVPRRISGVLGGMAGVERGRVVGFRQYDVQTIVGSQQYGRSDPVAASFRLVLRMARIYDEVLIGCGGCGGFEGQGFGTRVDRGAPGGDRIIS